MSRRRPLRRRVAATACAAIAGISAPAWLATPAVAGDAPDPVFTRVAGPALSGMPVALSRGDFDADGKTDLVALEESSIELFRGAGAGGFGAPQALTLPGARALGAVTVADVTRDGLADIVVTGEGASGFQAWVLAGRGSAAFGAAVASPVPHAWSESGYGSQAVADVTGDGNPDLVAGVNEAVSPAGGSKTFVLAGNGTGKFTETGAPLVDESMGAVAVGDANGDKRLDVLAQLVAPPGIGSEETRPTKLSAWLSDGTWFAKRMPQDMPDGSAAPVFADMNHDGRTDVVVASTEPKTGQTTVTVATSDTAGSFFGRQVATSVAGPVVLGEFNGDTNTDALVQSDRVQSLRGVADGTLAATPEPLMALGSPGIAATTGDFDGDNRADAIVATRSKTTTVLLNRTPSAPVPRPTNTSRPTVSGLAQVNQQLTAADGAWSGASSFSYQWERCDAVGARCAVIPGATAKTYKVVAPDETRRVRVVVTATNAAGSTAVPSAATAVVAADPARPTNLELPSIQGGTPRVNAKLTALPGKWSGAPTLALQWLRCDWWGTCRPITGATTVTYTPAWADLWSTLRFQVVATNAAGTSSAQSAATTTVWLPW